MEDLKNKKLKIIYLLGNSHSGSTVISFYLGSLKEVFYGGELKNYNYKLNSRTCTCGKPPIECPYWRKFIPTNKAYFTRKHEERNISYSLKSTFKGFFMKISGDEKRLEYNFIRSLFGHMEKMDKNHHFLLDSSKSLGRLLFLESIENLDIRVIYLKRNLRANLASFLRRGKGFWVSYFRIKSNNIFNAIFLKMTKLPVLKISYESFVKNLDRELNYIAEFIGTNTNERVKDISDFEFHVFTGNNKTRKQFTHRNHTLITTKNSDDIFSKSQKKVLSILGEKIT